MGIAVSDHRLRSREHLHVSLGPELQSVISTSSKTSSRCSRLPHAACVGCTPFCQGSGGRSSSCAGIAPNNRKPEKAFGAHRAAPRALTPSCGRVFFLSPSPPAFSPLSLPSERKSKPEDGRKEKHEIRGNQEQNQ